MPRSNEHHAEHVLFVHAHPDDETLTTGGTIATLIASGDTPTVLTATRGERGEMLTEELAPLAGHAEAVAAHRERELRAALAALGGPRQLWLGSPGARADGLPPRRYTDSGMQWGPDGRAEPVSDAPADALSRADFAELVADVRVAIRESHAETVVSYADDGGYGHPDHVLMHHVARHAAEAEGVPFVEITDADIDSDATRPGMGPGEGAATRTADGANTGAPTAPGHDTDDVILVDVLPVRARVRAALEQYRSQLTLEPANPADPLTLRWIMPHGARQEAPAVERFTRRPAGARTDGMLGTRGAAVDASRGSEPGVLGGAGSSAVDPNRGPRLLGAIAMVAVGLVIGALGTVTHQVSAGSVPIGAVLDLLLIACVLVGVRLTLRSRLLVFLEALVCFGVTLAMAYGFGSDTVLVPDNVAGQAWTLGQALIAIIVIMWPDFSRLRTRGGPRLQTSGGPRPQTDPDPRLQTGRDPGLQTDRDLRPQGRREAGQQDRAE
ncbi:PIG-L family deacetylase [Curtobacterium ammoniigenes]|uniref:PIG-L family deacetylase n=1 Tax=Curtobacterium ammoniigenes TaxID=395387 RepID=UPI000834D76B|nr:PIG-L family deacetylase [Curtobacterium ammoniigenes]